MLRPAVAIFLLTAIVLSKMAGIAIAGQFTVEPVKITFGERTKTSSVTVANKDKNKLTIQVSAVAWSQDEHGRDKYEKTKDFLFFPRLATLAPGKDRVVRIAYRGAKPKEREITYRLFIEELPVGDVPGSETAMRLTIKFSIPLFVEPQKKLQDWGIKRVYTEKRSAAVTVYNKGNGHIVIDQITATGYDKPGGSELFKRAYFGWYVLPGHTLIFPTPLLREPCLKMRALKMEVKVGEETKEMAGQVKPKPAECPSVKQNEELEKAFAVQQEQQASGQTQPAKKQ